jgi:hypothetical protein
MDALADTGHYIAAEPYPWPYNGDLRPDNTALIIIDMQTDFCGPGAMSITWATTLAWCAPRSSLSNAC